MFGFQTGGTGAKIRFSDSNHATLRMKSKLGSVRILAFFLVKKPNESHRSKIQTSSVFGHFLYNYNTKIDETNDDISALNLRHLVALMSLKTAQ